jgi:hypothetical protein
VKRALFYSCVLLLWLQASALAQQSYEQLIHKAASAVSLTSNSNPAKLASPIAFTAKVTGPGAAAPSGAVAYAIQDTATGAVVGTGTATTDANGIATWSSAPATGSYTVTADYAGDSNYLPSSANAMSQTVMGQPDFTLAFNSPSGAVKQGDSWLSPVTVKGINGFDGEVTLTCGSLPLKTSCDFTPAKVTATAQGVPSTLRLGTIATTVQTAGMATMVFGLFGVVLAPPKRRKHRVLCVIAILVFCAGMVACGAASGMRYIQTDGTPKGTYNITVTGISGQITHSGTVTVTVQ